MQQVKAIAVFSLAGAGLFGAFMLVGTMLLGHIRPMWMEVSYSLPCAAAGLFIGALLGLVLAKPTKR
jgi:hypothetical protein